MRHFTLVSPLILSLALGLSAQGQGRPQILPMPAPQPDRDAPETSPPEVTTPDAKAPLAPAPDSSAPDASAPSAMPVPNAAPQVLPQIAPAPPATEPTAQEPPTPPVPFGQGSAFGTVPPQGGAPQPLPPPDALAADPLRIAKLGGTVRALLSYTLDWPEDLGLAAQAALNLPQDPTTARGEGWEQVALSGAVAGLSGGCQRVTGKLMTDLRDKGALDEAGSWEGYAPEVVAAITRGGFLYDMPPEAGRGVSCAFDLGPTALVLGPQGLELQAMAEAMRLHFDPVDLRGVAGDTGTASPFGELPKAIGRGMREGDTKVLQAAVMAVAGQSPSDPYHWRLEIALWRVER